MGDSDGEVTYRVDDGVAVIRLERPNKLNALTMAMYAEVRRSVRRAQVDTDVDCVIVTGSGRAFSTGGDLKQTLDNLRDDDPTAIYRFEDQVPFDAIRHCTKPTIAAVNGLCMAGGMMIALSCDIAVASDRATFAIPEGRVGLAEAWLPNLLFGRISLARAKYLTLTGNSFDAAEALAMGLILEVVPHAQLLDRAFELVAEIRQTTPVAQAEYKRFFDRLLPTASPNDTYRALMSSDARALIEVFEKKSR